MIYSFLLAIILLIVPKALYSQSIEYRISKQSFEQTLNAMMKAGKFSFHTINNEPQLPSIFISENGVTGYITPYFHEYSVNIEGCSISISDTALGIFMPNVDFCFFGEGNKIEASLSVLSSSYQGTCKISEGGAPPVRKTANGSINTRLSLLIGDGKGIAPDTLFVYFDKTFASLSEISNFATCESFIDFGVSAPALDKMPIDSTKIELFTFTKNSMYNFSLAQIILMPSTDEIVITIPLISKPPIIQVENNLEGTIQRGKVQLKKYNEQIYSITEKSGFAIYDDLQGEYNAYFIDDNFESGNSRFRFQSAKKIANLKSIEPASLIGDRQIKILPGFLDTKYYGDYAKQNKLILNNSFDGVLANSGTMKMDGSSILIPFSDWYFTSKFNIPYSLEANNLQPFGLQWKFIGWSDGVKYNPRDLLLLNDTNLRALWKGDLTSQTQAWVQSTSPYSGNGTSSVVYYSTDPTYQTGLWLHQESGTGTREINLAIDSWTNNLDTPPQSMAVSDYNRQKSYVGYINFESGIKIVSVREYINGVETGFTTHIVNETDPVVQSFTPKAKLYLSGALTNYGTPFPAHANYFVLTVIDSSFIYTKTANLNPGTGLIESWSGWSTSVNPYKPKFVSNGKASYLVWLESGSVKCLRYKPGTNWGNPYTLYSNGPFYDFAAAVSPTDDLVLMMKRINSGGPALCTGKFYVNGSTMPLTVLETTTT
ncbi:MAG: hypothetical protein L6Q77_08355, partial [Bacteroidetes bacterium]|nr:hypothetical protein [Bacteroidota bacterium]